MRIVLHEHGLSGPPVVLVHGIPGAAAIWDAVARDLAADHRVLVPDLLGFGASDRPQRAEELWADAQAQALLAALDARGVDRAVLAGHDFGGPVALALARRAPERVAALALAATNVFGDTPIPLPLRAVTWPLVGGPAAALLFSRPSLALMVRQGASRPLAADDLLGDAAQVRAIGTVFAYALRDLRRLYAPLEETLRALDVPVLVVWGDRDPFFAVDQGRRTAQAAARGRFVLHEGAGHFLPAERAAELADDLRALAAEA